MDDIPQAMNKSASKPEGKFCVCLALKGGETIGLRKFQGERVSYFSARIGDKSKGPLERQTLNYDDMY
jgi:hypothetical protein